MRSLVTGGGGFIGRHLVRLLLERGETVRILELDDVPVEGWDAEVIRGSICDPDTVRRSLSGVDRLYHLAANPNLWAPDKRVFDQVNHQGTNTVLQAAARFDLQRIVYTSTESILSGTRRHGQTTLIDGSARLDLQDMPGPYCRSKYLAEQLALRAAEQGQPVVIVSPTLPIGPGDTRLTPPTRMMLGFLNRSTPAYLDSGFNLVDVRDVALGHVLAAEHGRIGERYILGNENLMLRELLKRLEELTGIPMPKRRVPYWLALTVSLASEFIADRITHRPPVAPVTGVRLASVPMFFDCSKAVQELGLVQTPIGTALADAVDWLADTGLLER